MALSQLQPKISRISSRKQQLERDLEHITQEMYKRNKELAETNRTLSLLRTIDSLVLESHDSIKVLSGQIASAVTVTTEYPLVMLLGQSQSRGGRLEPYGWSTGSDITLDTELLQKFHATIHH